MRLGGHLLKPNSVRGILARCDVVLMAPSIYTVPEKLAEWDHLFPQIEKYVITLMEADSAKQWNALELSRVLHDEGIIQNPWLHYHVLQYRLSKSEKFMSLGRGFLCLRSAKENSRITVKELAFNILIENGAPMKRILLERELRKRRSLGKGGFAPHWPLVMLGDGVSRFRSTRPWNDGYAA